jgi:hypothetical protein
MKRRVTRAQFLGEPIRWTPYQWGFWITIGLAICALLMVTT